MSIEIYRWTLFDVKFEKSNPYIKTLNGKTGCDSFVKNRPLKAALEVFMLPTVENDLL